MASGGQTTAVRQTATTTRAQPAAVPVVRPAPPSRPQLMSAIRVSSPTDAAEHEATSVAARVMNAPAPAFHSPYVSRFAGAVQAARSAAKPTAPAVGPSTAARITSLLGGGQPLPKDVKDFMEPRFGADFSGVRIHASESSAKLSNELSAQAFTVGNNVFFSRGAYQPQSRDGRELIAHELTHTIQQGAAPQRAAPGAVAMRVDRQVQRLGVSDALDYFADKANYIPGFRMFTIILGVNPINMSPVSRSAGNVLRAVIEFIPGGALLTEAMANHGVFDKAGAWVEQQISGLGMTGRMFKDALSQFIDSLSWSDIFHLGDVWDRARRIFSAPIDRLISFVKGLAVGILNLIKDAILRPLAKLAEGTRGYDLLKAVLGRDPITGDPVPRTADTLIGGFMKLIGQEDVWQNMKKANAVARCFAWFQGAMGALMGFVSQIPQLAIQAFKSLEIADVILVPRALIKVAAVFGNFIGKFITWAGNAVWSLLEIVFDAVSPGAWGYIKKTGAALSSILKNPLPFVGNLVKAAKLGFSNFVGRFLAHLKAGLLDWLTGSLPGIYIPKAFDLREILKFALSVLGLTWANIRQKLVKVVGEPVVVGLEKAFDVVVTLVRDGPAAAWEKIKEQLANLKDMAISGIMDMVLTTVVQKAVPKLISMFIPGAGFISAIISIYDTVMVFVNKIKQIVAVVKSFVDSIVAIAGGAIGAAAARVESALAGGLSLAINFLAGFIGLGKVADKVMGVIQKIRAPIDKALDWLINFIVTTAKKLFAWLFAPKDQAKGQPKAADAQQKGAKLPSAQVIANVKRDIEAKPHNLDSAAAVRSMIDGLAATHGPTGMSAIRVRQVKDGDYVIEAAASPFTFLSAIRRLATSDDGYTTAAVAFDDQIYGKPVNNEKRKAHAEERVVMFVRRGLRERASAGKLPNKVEVFVSQSPCKNRCTPALQSLRAEFPTVTQWFVYYTELYQGKDGRHAADSLEAADLLRQDGFHVMTFKEALDMARQTGPSN